MMQSLLAFETYLAVLEESFPKFPPNFRETLSKPQKGTIKGSQPHYLYCWSEFQFLTFKWPKFKSNKKPSCQNKKSEYPVKIGKRN